MTGQNHIPFPLPALLAGLALHPLIALPYDPGWQVGGQETVDGIVWSYYCATGTNGEETAIIEGTTGYYSSDDVGDYERTDPAIPVRTTGCVSIPSSLGGLPVIGVGSFAFSGCSGLTSITIPDGVTSIGFAAFSGCSGLTSITIPDSVKSIGRAAFSDCSGLSSITIPDRVSDVCGDAFSGCSSLASISVSATNPFYDSRRNCNAIIRTADDTLILGCKGTVIPEGVTAIGYEAFSACSGLASITIPNGVTNIEGSAFYNCSGLTSVTIPNSVKRIGSYAFFGCSGLSSVTIPNGVTSIEYSAFCRSGLKSITIPDSVTILGEYAFSDCPRLQSVTIGSRLTEVTEDFENALVCGLERGFCNCPGLMSFSVAAGNPVYSSGNGLLLSKDGTRLVRGVGGRVAVPAGVADIADEAFSGIAGLTSITIPDGVASIGQSAFSGCSGLASITIPKSMRQLRNSAFRDCSSLKSLTIPGGVSLLEAGTFSGCDGLGQVVIDGTVSMEPDAFPPTLRKLIVNGNAPSLFTYKWEDGVFEESPGEWIQSAYTGMMSGYLPNCTIYVKPGSTGWRTAIPGWWREVPIRYLSAPSSPTTYKVVFSANGGKGTMAVQTIGRNATAKLSANKFARSGWVFLGWAKTKTGAVAYANGAAVKNLAAADGTATLYAVWAKKAYKVKFVANGGTGTMAVETFTYGKAKKLSANKFKRDGYVFKGWATSKANARKGKVAYKNKKKVKNLVTTGKTVKLYAVWKKK